MGLVRKKLDFVACEKQRLSPGFSSMHSDSGFVQALKVIQSFLGKSLQINLPRNKLENHSKALKNS